MVSEIFTNATQGVAVMWGISPVNAVYFFAILFSVMIGIALGIKSGKPMMGVAGFFGMLIIFAMLNAFPIWIIGMALVIMVLIGSKLGGGSNE